MEDGSIRPKFLQLALCLRPRFYRREALNNRGEGTLIMTVCEALHEWANSLPALRFPFADATIPLNGIYVLFEHGEVAHGTNRIVRVGTHTGTGQLRSRLRQHFLVENKDRSIFRKNIGRALLNRDHDPFLPIWELDRTSRLAREARHQLRSPDRD